MAQLGTAVMLVRTSQLKRVRPTESGCLLKLTNGPSGFGFDAGGDQLAWVAALGLKPLSVGPLNEYREGGS